MTWAALGSSAAKNFSKGALPLHHLLAEAVTDTLICLFNNDAKIYVILSIFGCVSNNITAL
jgi:hypothetical protein